MLKIALIPIDNRPVCWSLPKQICDISKDIELLLPSRNLLGGLKTSADYNSLLKWLDNIENVDAIIIALDTIAYGGLVASRRTQDDFETIANRLSTLKEIIQRKNAKVYACSSIMRISNNNINEEEKEYWNRWGKKIFDYSYNLHKAQIQNSYDANAKFSCIRQIIPSEILDDYFETRSRNFNINKLYLKWQQEGILDYLVFSKDDCAEYGVNVSEANEILKIIKSENLNAIVKTGADEIPLSLLARAFCDLKSANIKIYPLFSNPQEIKLISKYEDISVYDSVKGQIELCSAQITNDATNADIILMINNFKKEQGELVMNISTELFSGELTIPQKPFIVADVVFANGADNNFIKTFFNHPINWNNFLGYAGWNTTANTLGSALCAGIFKYLSKNIDTEAFKLQQFIRFADDWAYQANCRSIIKLQTQQPNIEKIKQLMKPYTKTISDKLNFYPSNIDYNFPWKRFFEIEVLPQIKP